jgi:hypothetical protein
MRKRTVLIALGVLVIGSVAGWFIAKHYLIPDIAITAPKQEQTPPPPYTWEGETVTVKVAYPSAEGISYEERKIRPDSVRIKMAETILEEYLRGLPGNLRDTKLLGLYQDSNGVVYVDLSEDIRKNFSGDARYEINLLRSLVETITLNLEGVQDVRLLIEDKEVDTVGGHFQILYPLREWIVEQRRPPAE